ncbi:hypothetical protein PF008_g8183 [Phytophthora fragariae]|uniref:PHD-type domain-containing protein n=1 Tax=Phytophthora fragariae TaxID=53985 RepID=A0A6G0S205_9STRA|nr:hypothetical protein PF008_g8183 [Phytophthora fragariae]
MSSSTSAASLALKHASRPFRVGSDGLPLLPCHDAPVTAYSACASPPRAVSAFGSVDSPAAVRRQLEAQYAQSQQLPQLSEATLRADTELELLRRRCFAQRNAQWGYTTPDQVEFRPQPRAEWTPQPANAKLALRQAKIDGALDKELGFADARAQEPPLQPVRDRPWPPAEFALKTVAKPRGRGGKRKAAHMAAVLDPVPLLAKTCRECGTQSTPLWRLQMRGTTQVDLCLKCFLKLERADLFDKKRVAKRREERRKKEQAAAAALQEKKRLRHQIHALKKQQKEHKKQEAAEDEAMEEQVQQEEEEVEAPAAVILKFTREEIEAATGSSKERKKDRKHSRKDNKKKKKHRRKRDVVEESDSDGPAPIPSPAQMNSFVYADRAPEPYTTPQASAFAEDHADSARRKETMFVNTEPEALNDSDDRDFDEEDEEMASTPARSSSRKRKSVQRAASVELVESPASASKKRKTSSSRTPRSKRAAASAPPAPAVVAVPPAPAVKKRARTKKELARERELRALGQYCPVCSEVYEDDDQNTFVCCDSCELWVHGACDPSLTPEVIAAMANTEDKYICPLCAGR